MTEPLFSPGDRLTITTGRHLTLIEVDHVLNDIVVFWHLTPVIRREQPDGTEPPVLERNGCDCYPVERLQELMGFPVPADPDLSMIAVAVVDDKAPGWKWEVPPHPASELDERDSRLRAWQRGGWFVRWAAAEVRYYRPDEAVFPKRGHDDAAEAVRRAVAADSQ